MSKTVWLPASLLLAAWLAAAPTPALALAETESTSPSQPLPSVLLEKLNSENLQDESLQRALAGIRHLEQGRHTAASREFNAALQLDPSRSYLQLLNGLAYHLQGLTGDADKFALAEQGYTLAIQFDHGNWLARYFRGNLQLDRRQYKAAQADFAEALLYVDSDPEVLYQLAAASYLAGDPATAAAALHRLRDERPETPRVLRASAVVLAALGRQEEASNFLERYRHTTESSRDLRLVEQRVHNWQQVHARGAFIKTQFSGQESQNVGAGGTAPESGMPMENQPAFMAEGQADRMVLVDVVIIRTEDTTSTIKGTNLLTSLKLSFGSSSSPAYQTLYEKSTDQAGVATSTTTLKRGLTIPAMLDYSLNIANTKSGTNEILARPTLAALDGVKSEFFSGIELSAGIVAEANNGGIGASISIEKEIGVRLAITPYFLDDDRVKLVVEANRAFVKPPIKDESFNYRLETTKTTVNANVIMKFGETVILSGLSEKETGRTRDGVPVLQDIPLLQYLFSEAKTRDFQSSVLILLTPRRAQHVYQPKSGSGGKLIAAEGSEALGELRARYADWFKPYPNLASVFHHLGSSSLYREFRTGDVTLERWDRQATLNERLRQAVEFLFY